MQFKLSKYSFKTFAPKGLWDPSTSNLLFLTNSLSLPESISWRRAILLILVIPSLICLSLTFKWLIDLKVAIAVEIFSNWNWPLTFGIGSLIPPFLS